MLKSLKEDLQKMENKEKKIVLKSFFKTGKGQYGERDLFLGVSVPEQRKIAKKYKNLPLNELQKLLNSKIHEHRLTALLILVDFYEELDEKNKKIIVDFYLKNIKNVNNWDLVDLSAPKILGDFLLNRDRKILDKLATSRNLWKKRIAIISTFAFIKKGEIKETFRVSEILLDDKNDLIHKAVGWMLREAGKKDLKAEEEFLLKNCKKMSRTTLRYAIEKFPETKRKKYLMK